ncbi:CPBP family intramembrane glutamic endopeptidase [Novosphingobium sp.]|uniref:CPBP family intramembrane glutamic endopeptidase n=1 Tax=Novosphingobium sp. TaxID=1874826 RepID=UPI003B51A7FF
MAIAQSDKRSPAPGLAAAFPWLILAGGLTAAIGWVLFGQKLGDTIVIVDPGAAMAVYYLLLFLPLIALALLLGIVGGQNVIRIGRDAGRWAGAGVALGLIGLMLTLGLSWLNGSVAWGSVARAGVGGLVLGSGLTLIQVAAEEILFRGWLQPALIARIGPPAGIAVGAVLFAAFHLTAAAMGPVALVNITLAGIWFGVLALRSGGVLAPLAAHFAWNVTEDIVLGMTPNPGTGPLGSLLDLDLVGGPWWGAQADGLNSSIGTTVVLIALVVPFAWRWRYRA